jgi:hypothetical protein
MSKSTAVRGLTFSKWLSPFYDTARRFLGISPATVDAYLAKGATAKMDGNVIALAAPDGAQHVATVRAWHKSKAAAWVNKFNERSHA